MVLLFCVTVWLVGTMEGEASVFTVGGREGEDREGRRGRKKERKKWRGDKGGGKIREGGGRGGKEGEGEG